MSTKIETQRADESQPTAAARVFIFEPHGLPLKNAPRFGRVVYVYDENSDRPSIWSDEFIPHVLERLEHLQYNPKVDYFVVVGHLVPLVMLTCSIVGRYGSVKALMFSSTDREYVPRELS